MKIFVKAKPGAREEYVKKLDDINFEIAVKAPPVKGRANAAIIQAVAEHFRVSPTQVSIVSGWTSRQKVIEIK